MPEIKSTDATSEQFGAKAKVLKDMDIGIKNGRIVGVRGRSVDRINRGRLGAQRLAWLDSKSVTRPIDTAIDSPLWQTARIDFGRCDAVDSLPVAALEKGTWTRGHRFL